MILNKIIESKKQDLAKLPKISRENLKKSPKDFMEIFQKPFVVIGEIKSKSPSEGVICADFDPISIAKSYEKAGVDALSVLTDEPFFGGSFEVLEAASEAVALPAMCKEFIIDEQQILHARASGAAACLLIVRILSDEQLKGFRELIESLGMTALVEVFDEQDTERAIASGAKLIGINNRDLDTLEMDTKNAARIKPLIPEGIPVLSLSGVKTPDELQTLKNQFEGVLIGTALMRSENPGDFLSSL